MDSTKHFVVITVLIFKQITREHTGFFWRS